MGVLMSAITGDKGRVWGYRCSVVLGRAELAPFRNPKSSGFCWSSARDLAKLEAPSGVQSCSRLSPSLAGWKSRGRRWRSKGESLWSQGCHGDLRSGPSWWRKGCGIVAWPRRCGQSWTKATSWWTGRSLAADTWTDGQKRGMEGLGEGWT